MDFQSRLEAAQAAAREAGAMLRSEKNFKIREKADNDFVTEMDERSEKLIRAFLLSRFPEDGFYGEESGASDGQSGRWVVDPIDGTQTFMRGMRGYTISIAYQVDDIVELGVVYAPELDEMFTAVRGQGAFLNGKPIHVSEIKDAAHSIVDLGYGHRVEKNRRITVPLLPQLFEEISDIRRSGSAAYDLCCLACGRVDGFFELGLFLYDYAAACRIILEAGGCVTGWSPEENFWQQGDLIASNGHIHSYLQSRIHR